MDAWTKTNPGSAVILAGGLSRRLGRDKAAVTIDGQTLLARMVALGSRFCPQTAVSGRDPAPFLPPGNPIPWFADLVPDAGPLGGIVTALATLQTSCLILSCDLPHMDQATIATLIDAWRIRPAAAVMTTYQQTDTGYIEALVAIYEPSALPLLRQAHGQGVFSLSKAIPPALRHHIPYDTGDPSQARPFYNLNTPADLAELGQQGRLNDFSN